MNPESEELKADQWTSGVITKISPIGIHVRLLNGAEGLLYKNEIFQDLNVGEQLKVYIKKIREDGKIDLSLQKGGYKNFITDSTQIILDALEAAGGFLPLTDKTDPFVIQDKLHISKKKYKEAVGALYKARQIEITETGIRLV